jgi:Cu2+-exporting ATPase
VNPASAAASAPQERLAILDDAVEWGRFTRWSASAAEGMAGSLAESSLRIGGMHCAACAEAVEQALARVPGVLEARVSAAAECATVRWNPALTRPSAMVAAVAAAGYSAVPDTAAGARDARRREERLALWRLFVAALCAMQVMMLATPSYLGPSGGLAPDIKQLLDWGSWLLTLPVMAFSATPFFAGAWRAAKNRRIGMDVPVALGIAAAFVASSGAAFAPGGLFGHEVYFDSLTMFVAFLLGGRYLEMRARHRAAEALERTVGELPRTVLRVREDGTVESVSALRLARGDTVRVPAGEAFAADGVLLAGSTHVDEALLSGESRPVPRRAGDALVAGSINLSAPVTMRVERVGADTRHEAIVALMREAQTQRPAALRSGERWAAPFLWTVLALAGAAAAWWSVVDPSRAVWVAVSVLIVTCPCALSLAAPSALLAAAGAMARRGVLLRRLDAIEGLVRMRTLFVDKTGTLTEGALGSVQVDRLGAAEALPADDELLRHAASLGAWSSHPLARRLAAAMPDARESWRDVAEHAGRGIQGVDERGAVWRLGAAAWVGEGGVADLDAAAACWLGRDGRCLARFSIDDRLRDDAIAAAHALRADGVRIELVSGDAPHRVERIGRALGADAWAGGLQPQDKLAAIAAAQARGEVVAMVGDGVNDAPVLARADVSFAMGEGALVARSQADGVLVGNRLGDVVQARMLARRTLRVVRQNLAWAAVYNAACVPLALAGWLPPWAAGLGMATSSLAVVLNSLRLAR